MTDYDEALTRFHQGELEYLGGLANHGPMAADALRALGHPTLIPAWVDRYAARVPPRSPGSAIPDAERASALGVADRGMDWVATFEEMLAEEAWTEVLAREIRPLLGGAFAAATHGILRTAHAVRGLEDEDKPGRRLELAMGLGYWASRHQGLPGVPGERAEAGFGPARALAEIPAEGQNAAPTR